MIVFWIWCLAHIAVVGLIVAFAKRSLATAARTSTRASSAPDLPTHKPSVAVIKPIRGMNAHTEECFRSWLKQDYSAKLEIIFSFQDPQDPALPLARKLQKEFEITILINEIKPGFSGKASNIFYGIENSTADFLILSDADMLASPGTLSEIVSRAQLGSSIVSCLPIHTLPVGPWAKLYASTWNEVLVGVWAPAMAYGRSPGIAGGTVGCYRKDLIAVGGVENLSDYVAEDLKMGSLFKNRGFKLVLGPVVESKVGHMTFRQYWNAIMRAAFVSWSDEVGGKTRSLLFHLFAYAYSPLLIYSLFFKPSWIAPCAAIFAARLIATTYVDFLAERKVRIPFALLPNDSIRLHVFVHSLITRKLEWAGVRYRITANGRMVRF